MNEKARRLGYAPGLFGPLGWVPTGPRNVQMWGVAEMKRMPRPKVPVRTHSAMILGSRNTTGNDRLQPLTTIKTLERVYEAIASRGKA